MILQSLSSSRKFTIQRLLCDPSQRFPLKPSLSQVFSIHRTKRNSSSSIEDTKNNTRKRETKIQIIGNQSEYDAIKQLRLIQLPDEFNPDHNLLASMHVKRNIIFGTRIHDNEYLAQVGGKRTNDDGEEISSCERRGGDNVDNEKVDIETHHSDDSVFATFDEKYGFVKVCRPLLIKALEQATKEGDQPQGLAALTGLCSRVQYLIENPLESEIMMKVQRKALDDDEDKIVWEAIQSVATQIPRAGHDTVGLGTYFDSRKGWTELAKEYALSRRGSMIVQGEAQLFQSNGAVLVGIEYIGEENPKYWIEAGGSMARFIFV